MFLINVHIVHFQIIHNWNRYKPLGVFWLFFLRCTKTWRFKSSRKPPGTETPKSSSSDQSGSCRRPSEAKWLGENKNKKIIFRVSQRWLKRIFSCEFQWLNNSLKVLWRIICSYSSQHTEAQTENNSELRHLQQSPIKWIVNMWCSAIYLNRI